MLKEVDWALFFQKASPIAVIVTLLFAIITYWIDFIRKNNFKKQLKEQLITELRKIYFVCRENIVDYRGFVDASDKMRYSYPKLNINSSVCNYLISSGYFLKITKDKVIRSKLLSVVEIIKVINNAITTWSSGRRFPHNYAPHAEYLFESGYTALRDRILEISEQGDFFTMNIVSKEQYKTYRLLMRSYKKNKVKNKKKLGLLSQILSFNKRFSSLMKWYKNILIRIKKERELLSQEINFGKSIILPKIRTTG